MNRTTKMWILSALALHFILSFPTFKYPFMNFDDPWIVNNSLLSKTFSASGLQDIFFDFSKEARMRHGAEYLPIRDLTASLQYLIFKDNPVGYRLTQWLLYVSASLLTFGGLWHLGFKTSTIAVAFGFFLIHPLHVEPVTWLASHKDVLSFFLLAVTLFYYIKVRYFWAFVFFTLGVFTKYHLMMFPLLMPLIDRLLDRPLDLKKYFIFALVSMGSFALAVGVSETVQYGHMNLPSQPWAFIPDIFFLSLKHWILPYPLYLLYPHSHEPSVLLWAFFILVMALILFLLRRNKKVVFGLSWSFIFLIPMLKAPTMHFLADRYLLIPSVMWAVLSATVLTSLSLGKIKPIFIALIFFVLGFMHFKQSQVWSTSENLWKHSARFNPEQTVTQKNLAALYLKKQEWGKSLFWYRKLTSVVPKIDFEYSDFWSNRGLAAYQLSFLDEAKDCFLQSLAKTSTYEAHLNLGVIFARQKQFDQATLHFEQSIVLAPHKIEPILNLILVCLQAETAKSCKQKHEKKLQLLTTRDPRRIALEKLFNRPGG